MNGDVHESLNSIYTGSQSSSGALKNRFLSYDGNFFHDSGSGRRRNSIIAGVVAVLLYLLLFGAILAIATFEQPVRDDTQHYSGTILVSFGNDSSGSGMAARGGSENSLLTQRESDVKMHSIYGQQPMERTVNSRALFPGTDSSSHDLNQGNESGAGATSSNQNGEQESEQGNAESLSGNFSLEGRKLIGDLPLPDYETDAHGRVIINITVDENGRVEMARLEPVGSTTNSKILIDAAIRAALKAQFSSSSEFLASGTITYIFRMN
ncbi:MAG: energy transducer TonB [Rikenellaceae bacterium]